LRTASPGDHDVEAAVRAALTGLVFRAALSVAANQTVPKGDRKSNGFRNRLISLGWG
jgi:hypothetical protein